MVKKADSTPSPEDAPEVVEVSVDAETVDAGSPEVAGDESITLAVKPGGDEL